MIEELETLIKLVPYITDRQITSVLEVVKSYPNNGKGKHRGIPGVRGGSLPRQGGVESGGGDDSDLENKLTNNRFKISADNNKFEHGAFESYLVDIEGDGRAINKPPLKGDPFPYKSKTELSENEVNAYELSKELGLDIVPPTVMRQGASFQQWIEGCVTWNNKEDDYGYNTYEDLGTMTFLDVVNCNVDRHGGNIIVHKDTGRVYAIDNGLTRITEWDKPDNYFSFEINVNDNVYTKKVRSIANDLIKYSEKRKHLETKYGINADILKIRLVSFKELMDANTN